MKKPLARELILLSLPSLLIVCAVLWKSGGQRMWNRATEARVSIGEEGIVFGRQGPLLSQNTWNDQDFYLLTGLNITDPLRRTHGVAPVDVRANQFVDQRGRQIKPPPSTYSYLAPGYGRPDWLRKYPEGSTTVLSCDLDRIPLSRGEITLRSRWILPNGRFQPFSVIVRPAWFCRSPRTIQLVKARWLSKDKDGHEGAEIVIAGDSTTAELIFDGQIEGSEAHWEQRAPNNPASISFPRPHLLYNWSPRFLSNDERYDSHTARDAHVWAGVKAHQRTSVSQPLSVRPLLDGFKPSIMAELTERHGNTIKIIYHFDGVRTEPRAQQFVTDIGVPGDGFLRVKLPVPPRKTK